MNALYDKGRQSFLEGGIAWLTDNIKVVLVSAGYVVNLATDQFLSDIPAPSRIATSANMTGKTSTAGVASANNQTFPTVSGASVIAAVIYQDTGVPGTSRLVAYIDTATGLPVVPSGGDIIIEWDTGVNKIFKL